MVDFLLPQGLKKGKKKQMDDETEVICRIKIFSVGMEPILDSGEGEDLEGIN